MKKSVFLSLLLSIFLLNVNAQTSFQKNDLSEIEKIEIPAKINNTKIPWIENTGQQHSDVAFYANVFSGTVFVTDKGEIVYNFSITGTKNYALRETFVKPDRDTQKSDKISGKQPSQTKVNYFIGNNRQNNISTYQTVNIGEVWDGINVKLNAYGNNIEKLFYVKPGTSPEKIKIKLQGAKRIKISETGELIIKTCKGDIKFTKPVAYQIIKNKKEYIDVAYTTKGKTYGFITGNYNPDYELVIDPLIASTFVGGANRDDPWFLALDDDGNVFVTGETSSSSYPTTTGAYNVSANGGYDVFISKFSPDLQNLLISTFIGGSGYDYSRFLAFDSNNNIYITGNTASNDFPMAGTPYDNTLSGPYDVFIAKLNSDLSSLLASTYIGGTNADKAYSIAIDNIDNVFITGFTKSSGYPTTTGAFDELFNGDIDVFVSKFTSDLSTLSASTFMGGSESDITYSLVLDGSGNVYITGETSSSNYPTTAGVYDPSHNGSYDAFISKFTPDLTTLSASTFIGSTASDYGYSMNLDGSNNVYITGYTTSNNFPTSATAYDNIHNGSYDVFVSKFTSNLSTLSASTFIGGSDYEEANSIALDNSDNVFITGYTWSSDFPTSTTAYDNSYNTAKDVFISKFNSDLSSLSASTFLGGSGEDSGTEIAVDNAGNVFVTGYTTSSNYPTTASAYDVSYAGDDDVFISKLDNNLSGEFPPVITSHPENQMINIGENAIFGITATGADSYRWQENTGSSFEDITDGGIYSGAETDTLTITGVSLDMTGYQYQCIATNTYGNTTSNIAELTVLTDIENIQSSNIKIFPNPTTGIFTIETNNNLSENLRIQSVEILNIWGQTIKRLTISNLQLIIDLSGQTKGIYFVKIQTTDFIKIEKIIVE
ncbi:MAG: SBBP repeat-containing protein [Bacteroidales bacterium]|nr:SBBP repeat-containing protein [Bacteroidales bacterium]